MNCFGKLGFPLDGKLITKTEVKQRWRQLAAEHHPDRGGDGETFDQLRKAYEEALKTAINCPECLDRGTIIVSRGFSQIKLPCPHCPKD